MTEWGNQPDRNSGERQPDPWAAPPAQADPWAAPPVGSTQWGPPGQADPWAAPPAQAGQQPQPPTSDPWARPGSDHQLPPDPWAQPGAGQQPGYGQSADPWAQPSYGQQPGYGQPGYPPPGYPQHQYGPSPYGQPGYPPAGYPQQYGPTPYGQGYLPPAGAQNSMMQIPGLGAVKVASIGQRFLARLVDSVIYFVVLLIGFGVLGSSSTSEVCDAGGSCYTSTSTDSPGFFLSTGFVYLFVLLYEWLMIAFKGQTLGKMALRVKVVRQVDGKAPGLGKAFLREFILVVSSVLTCGFGGLLMYISVFFDRSGRNQTWYDKAATTQVISVR
jgi:uncharacterized RDD family membrane protein YckC